MVVMAEGLCHHPSDSRIRSRNAKFWCDSASSSSQHIQTHLSSSSRVTQTSQISASAAVRNVRRRPNDATDCKAT